MNKIFKKYVIFWLCTAVLGITLLWAGFIFVDPFGIWGSPVVNGFNNYKAGQPATLDLWKPYQYRSYKPDVVYLGTSRVYVGLAPKDYPDKSANVYNMGMSSLTLPDALSYVKFMIKVHKPSKIYMGIEFFQFGQDNIQLKRPGFSKKRLNMICDSSNAWKPKIKETPSIKHTLKTIGSSLQNPNSILFEKGWNVKLGQCKIINASEWGRVIINLIKNIENIVIQEESYEYLRTIVEVCKQNGIETELYFSPLPDIYLYIRHDLRLQDAFDNVKRRVADICPFRDFAVLSDITATPSNFADASHCTAETGAKCLFSDTSKKLFPYITSENIEEWLDSSRKNLEEAIDSGRYELIKESLAAYRDGHEDKAKRLIEAYLKTVT